MLADVQRAKRYVGYPLSLHRAYIKCLFFEVFHFFRSTETECFKRTAAFETLFFRYENRCGLKARKGLAVGNPLHSPDNVNGDGQVTAQDASLILQYVAGKITGFWV